MKEIVVSDSDKRIIDGFTRISICTVPTVKNSLLDLPVSCHADCAVIKVGNHIFAERKNAELLAEKGYRVCPVDGIFSPYPNDVKLNAKLFGKKILCNKKFIAGEIFEFAQKNGYTIIHCNQGYAACSTVKIDDKTAITDDKSVYNALSDNGIECLLVSKGSVKLEGYNCGFIGGCCGMIEEKTAVFAGSLDSHSDADLIRNFLISKEIKIVELFSGNLTDFGGFIPLNF